MSAVGDEKSFDPLFSVSSGIREHSLIEVFLIMNYNQLTRGSEGLKAQFTRRVKADCSDIHYAEI